MYHRMDLSANLNYLSRSTILVVGDKSPGNAEDTSNLYDVRKKNSRLQLRDKQIN